MNWRNFPEQHLPEILEVALQEFVTRGYEATSVRTIAKQVGVSVPALYYHYENKQAILVALLDRAMSILDSRVDDALAETSDEPAARLAILVEAIVLYITHHRELALMDLEIRSLTPENREQYAIRRDKIEKLLTHTIAAGCDTAVFKTTLPREASRAILSMCLGIANWYRSTGRLRPQQIAEQYVILASDVVRETKA